MQSHFILNSVLVLLGLTGYLLAQYIYRKKNDTTKPLVCPLRSNCDVVITSKYSKLFGVAVEVWGMLYYMAIAIFHAAAVAYPPLLSETVAIISMGVSTLAVIFSLYLVSVQAFVLRQWCTWCLCSAFLCAAIFLETYASTPATLLKSLVF